MRKVIRRRLVVPVAVGALVAVALVAGLGAGRDDGPPRINYVVSTSAPPTDGAAYTREAIENLRGMERFRFEQQVSGVGTATDPGSGNVEGEVDLANSAGDVPKYKTKVKLKTPAGEDANVEQLVVDDELHLKGPKQDKFTKSATKAKKAKGKKVGGGEQVDVVDPVMQVLEPVDNLDDSAFGTPSDVDSSGNRSVEITLPQGAKLVLSIDDSTRLISGMAYTRDGRTATFKLSDYGSTGIDIDSPS